MVTHPDGPALRLYNALRGAKEEFQPTDPKRVTLYVCRPTEYDYAHIGNARPAVVSDVPACLLRQRYPGVLYARNLTDVDAKINAAATAAGSLIGTITEHYIAASHADMEALGARAPDLKPRVTEHMPEIIVLIQTLIDRSHAHEAERHVLFQVASLAGVRIEVAPYKEIPWISCFGGHRPRNCRAGTAPGATDDPVGILGAWR